MEIFIDTIFKTIEQFLVHQRVVAPILLLLLEESGIPIPVPGDAIIAFTGYNISKGVLSFPMAFILINLSVLTGSSILYYLSSRYGQQLVVKFGKYLHLSETKLNRVENEFRRFGPLVIIFGRHIPGFRIPITVFAGVSKVSYKTFIISTFISTVFWILFYLYLGARLGRRVVTLFRKSSYEWWFGLVVIIIFVLVLVYLKRKKVKSVG